MAGPYYRQVANVLLSGMMGADLYKDHTERPIEDKGPLEEFGDYLRGQGHTPYVIPGGSDHRSGNLGFVACAAEVTAQAASLNKHFAYTIHCTGSSSIQSGLLARFSALQENRHVVGIPDDYETEIKRGGSFDSPTRHWLKADALRTAAVFCFST